jgi:hypothetical protein
MAQEVAKAGFTCANTYFAYDEYGAVLSDGGWMNEVFANEIVYPAVNLPLAITMVGDIVDLSKISSMENDGQFILVYHSKVYQSENLVDALLELWINHKS